jgi:DNA-binding CsgD family transcriptional regulator
MYRFEMLREADMAALLRLVGEVTELPADKTVRRTHVLAGLLKMIGGRCANAMEMAEPGEGPLARPGTIITVDAACQADARAMQMYLISDAPPDPAIGPCMAARGRTITMTRQIDDRAWYQSEHYNVVRRPLDVDHSIYCVLQLPDGTGFGVGLQRAPGDPPFTEREKAMVHLLHTNAPHVYCVPEPQQSQIDQLAPRLRPVVRCLLQGDAEKEVAAKLKLSRHTVHRYTQVVYRQLQVHSRGELLAKFARSA